jgi:4a-hydroxytetrahydrobiopterin dehydratase
MPSRTTGDQLDERARNNALARLKEWKFDDNINALTREYRFNDFAAAFAFMTRVAFECEKMNHHPAWTNVYNRVSVRLSTHDAGGITQRDINLAKIMDSLATSPLGKFTKK